MKKTVQSSVYLHIFYTYIVRTSTLFFLKNHTSMSTLDILKFHSKCVKLSRNYLSANTTTNNFIRITLNQTGQMLGLSEN